MSSRPFVSADELKEQVSGKASESEALMNSLLRSIGRTVGIPAASIRWDPRTNQGDGGKDLIVDAEHTDDKETFLPMTKSYWSIKSGADGLKKSKFRSEIENHPEVLEWLKKGNTYVWCSLFHSTDKKRKEIENDVPELVKLCKNSFQKEQILFRWIDQVADTVNLHPAVVLQHIPIAMSRRGALRTLKEWELEDTSNTHWVDFDGRDALVEDLIRHFLGRSEPNVLHIAGMSGIGKSRLVREACTRMRDIHQVECLYCENYEQIKDSLPDFSRLFDKDRHAILVFDEVPFDRELDRIESYFKDALRSLRIVTISPSVRQTTQTRGNRILLGEPSGSDVVLSVIRQAKGVIPEERLNNIAAKSSQDLRFALRWVQEVNRDPDAAVAITGGAMPLLDHIIKRCGLGQSEQDQLRSLYDAASCFIDIGVAGDVKHEVEALSERFSLHESWLGKAIDHARDYGLSAKSKNYIEATPRGLADMVFAKRGWATVSRDLHNFFDALPQRLQQKFLERCQDSSEEIREEVTAQLGNYFRGALMGAGVLSLENTQAAKVFSAWAKFDPIPALNWLGKTVVESSNETLLKLTGNEGYGDYRGRRYIVWLCESLARFSDLFYLCEEILFKLAIAENEPRIGNNATKVWRNLFWPTLSQVSIPFADRARLLEHRLRNSGGEARKICIDCALEALQPKNVGMVIPPQIVGGRLAPEPWRATSGEELLGLRTDLAKSVLQICSELAGEEKEYFINAMVRNLMPFGWLDLMPEVRAAFGTVTSDKITTELVAAIRRATKIFSHERYGSKGAAVARQLRDWEDSFSPANLSDRVKFWIQQNPWDVNEDEAETNPFEQLADEIVRDPGSLNSLATELSDPKFNGTITLATFCGGKAKEKELDELIAQWIARGESSFFVTGFLLSRSKPDVGLEEKWRAALDSAIDIHPEYVGNLTAYADASVPGYHRIAALLDNGFTPVTKMLSQLGFGHWTRAVSVEIQLDICERLERSLETEPNETIRIAIDLLYMWTYVNGKTLPQHLYAFALKFLEVALERDGLRDSFKWMDVAGHLVNEYPQRIAELAIEAEIDKLGGMRFDSESLDELMVKCAQVDNKAVMGALGQMLKDDGKNAIYSFHRHDGVFEAIGVAAIEEWIAANGSELLPHIASHLASPRSNEAGVIMLSDVLQWLFTTHEFNDAAFQGFLNGRHRLESWWGNDKAKKVEQQMQVFLTSEIRLVRQWASWEIEHWRHMQDWFDEIDEKRDRS